jgi:integrase
MARVAKRLSARSVATIDKPGLHADGDGLYLVVDKAGGKRWALIFQWQGKRSEMGLGRLADVSLADARDAAYQARQLIRAGTNPIEARKAQRKLAAAEAHTFGSFADDLIDKLASEFRNGKHIDQWRMTLGDSYCASLRPMRLTEVDTAAVLAVLSPVWTKRPETASRVRGRIERVLDAAKAAGLREGENPARWRGHLQALLPKRQKLTRGHHRALPYQEVPQFVSRLREDGEGMSALALEWTILTAARTSETLGALWKEIDLAAAVWTIPAVRMKAGRDHRVPLSPRLLEILTKLESLRTDGDHLFPGGRRGRPLSGMSMTMQLRRMKVDATVHGFRSSFRDWVSETTHFSDTLAEAALAHVVGDATERAYRRGDALERRRELMVAWSNYCDAAHSLSRIEVAASM